MRVMVLVKANKDSEAGKLPSAKALTAMMKFNEELVKAGIMLQGEGLKDSSKGKRVHFTGSKRTVIDGPFTETKELVSGYAILQVKDMDEAVRLTKRFLEVVGEGESEIRLMHDAPAFDGSGADQFSASGANR